MMTAAYKNIDQIKNRFDAAVALMDDEIREQVHAEIAPCTEEEFLVRYMELHLAKYGEEFTI